MSDSLQVRAQVPAVRDTSVDAARLIRDRARWVPNRRQGHAHEVWSRSEELVWSIRSSRQCWQELVDRQIPAAPQHHTPTVLPTPVQITGPVAGVEFSKSRPVPLIISCELAVKLPAIAEVLAEHGVVRVEVMSAYRRVPATSFHSVGLALDLSAFETAEEVIRVADHFEHSPDEPTCSRRLPESPQAQLLHHIACDLSKSGFLSTVITPNYDANTTQGHHDHFHIDIRPNDNRAYLR